MATSIGSLALKLVADPTGLVGGLSRAASSVAAFSGRSVAALAGIPGRAVSALGTLGRDVGGIRVIGDAAASLLGTPLKLAAEAESAALAMRIMIGDADKANKVLADIQEFATATPFESGELIDASKQLIAMGIDAGKVVDTLKLLGNVGSGLNVPIGEMAQVFGKIRSKGRAMTEELNQFAERGVPIFKALGQVLGVDEAQVRSFAEAGKIGFNDVARAFMAMNAPGAQFAGMMEEQAQTLGGKWSTLVDNFKLYLRAIGESAAKGLGLKGLMDTLSDWLAEGTQRIGAVLTPIFEAIGGAVRGVLSVVKQLWEEGIRPLIDSMGDTSSADRFTSWRDGAINAIEAVAVAVTTMVAAFQNAGDLIAGKFAKKLEFAMAEGVEKMREVARVFDQLGVLPGGAAVVQGLDLLAEKLREDASTRTDSPEADAAIDEMTARTRGFFDRVRQSLTQQVEGLEFESQYIDALAGLAGPDITDPNARMSGAKDAKLQLAGALESGSQGAQSIISRAIAAGLGGGKNDLPRQQLAVQQQQLAAQLAANNLLAQGGLGLADIG